uniref:Zinc knuckle CX2CX4HX4C domain-containing protein n=1 Tax=Cannabis sativa TaxID=3483 RepID=A0A803P964_CANSA
MKVGEWVGEYIDVYEDSLHEKWGPFIRIRVWIDISHPLMRGKMASLPNVRDEHWLEFRYENLPIFCSHCGRLGHPFEKCIGFLELVDNGVEPDLPFGPFMIAKARHNTNKIKMLQTSDGNVLHTDVNFATKASSFFSQLFTTSVIDNDALNVTLPAITSSITADMNVSLLKDFTFAEVEDALHSIAPHRSPSIDGMSAMFFQHHWDIVGPLVSKCVLQILNDGADISAINSAINYHFNPQGGESQTIG